MSEAMDKCVDLLVSHKKKENDAIVSAFTLIWQRLEFLEKENECRKAECHLLISCNKETHRRLLELEQYILR